MATGRRMRRSYSAEYKMEAVRRAAGRPAGITLAHIARELGLTSTVLGDWVRQATAQAGAPATDVFPGHGRQSAADEELRQLRRENARLAEENAFLKKAAAYFARAGQ